MATITRIEAIEQIQKVLKAYACKIYELRHDAECLPPAGKAIIDSTGRKGDNRLILLQ